MHFSSTTIGNKLLSIEPPGGQTRIASYLPLNHVAGQMLDIMGPLMISGLNSSNGGKQYATLFFPAKCFIKKTCFKEALADARPTTMLGVPAVWEGLKVKLEVQMSNPIMSMLPKSIILKALGLNDVVYALTGDGPIAASTLQYFMDFGLKILNMYGQSETTALGTAWKLSDFENFEPNQKFGSIGRCNGMSCQIA